MIVSEKDAPIVLSKGNASAKRNVDKAPPDAAVVTLEQLSREMKVTPREARLLLRLAAKQAKLYPTLGKEHVARQPWQWALGSAALDEARRALANTAAEA